jgi:pilus assembly protein TadC
MPDAMRSWLVALALAGAVVLMLIARVHAQRERRTSVLSAFARAKEGRHRGPFDLLTGRLGRSRVARVLIRRDAFGSDLEDRVTREGRGCTVSALAGRGLLAAILASATGLVIAAVVPSFVLVAPVLALVGLRIPAVAVTRRAKRRSARIDAQVPELVELLVAASESGLPPPSAFVRSADALDAPLGDELREAASRVRLGEPWRASLARAVSRTGAPSLATLARSLERSHRLGASATGALHALVDELRAERRARAEERARRAPVKMLFPLVFLILPAFLLLTVGPVLLSTIRSLH